MSEIQYIKNEAISLGVGETATVECCFCGKPKLSITRKDDAILYNCWSASCPNKGVIGSMPSELITRGANKFKSRPYRAPTHTLDYERYEILHKRYWITRSTALLNSIRSISDGGILMPLFDGRGDTYGNTTKYWNRGKKAMHWIERESPMNHYAYPRKNRQTAVLVEDALSAMRVSQDCEHWQGIALLGTDLNDGKIKDILSNGYNSVIIALDPDAHAKGIKYVQRYQLFFNRFEAVCLPADPKDLYPTALKEMLQF